MSLSLSFIKVIVRAWSLLLSIISITGKVLIMQVLGPHQISIESEMLGLEPSHVCLLSPPGEEHYTSPVNCYIS